MTDRAEKKRRRAIVLKIAEKGRAEAEARMPLPKATLRDLFDVLDERLSLTGCDGTRWHTRVFLQERHLPAEPILAWLLEYGGGCDCEVLGNVEEGWGEIVGSVQA
jgi:hypothetical protein